MAQIVFLCALSDALAHFAVKSFYTSRMNLALIPRICFILSVSLGTALSAYALEDQSGAPSPPPPAQASQPAPASPAQTPPPNSTQTKPPTKPKRHKKTTSSNCVPAASDPKTAAPTDSANSNNRPADTAPASAGQTPCPAPKKVIRDGGSSEPSIQLSGGTTGEQAMQQRSTEQLTAATEENLKQISGRQLSASQQDMVTQIKQFMDQSKSAIAAGDSERGHNLAEKAHLLSEDLVKP
jgi:hypothetical protein